MLINASHEEESRVAIVESGYLQELDIESSSKTQTKSNIYKGTITKVEPSLQACFVEYGSGKQGFLPMNEIHPDLWKAGIDKDADPRKLNIQDVLERRQELLVQVVKEERGNKGAALTTFISLAGRYLVLSPNTERGGISRKLTDEDRQSMREILKQLDVPENMGLIIRTAGKDQTLEALERDYSYLRRLWDEIRIKGDQAPSPSLIYLDGDLATRAIRDHFSDDIEEIWVDKHDLYQQTKNFVHAVLPGKEKLVKLYRGKKPLFRQYGIEQQCEEIHDREVELPSGGAIVFDPTEALTSIDVNSAKSTGNKNIDETALATNLEAAEEIARQLRIRDIGGLIVIDFIDMASRKHAQQIEEKLRDCTKGDKARIQFARISRFGLLEMSRQRLHPSVRESTTEVCPRCQGRGSIRTVESMALQMLARIEDFAEEGKKPTLVVQVPTETGEYLMNNKRDYIARTEEIYEISVNLQIRPELEIPHYRIERQWKENEQQRTEVLEDTTKSKKPVRSGRKLKPSKPIVGIPEPLPEAEAPKKGLFARIAEAIFGPKAKPAPELAPRRGEERHEERRDDRRGERGKRREERRDERRGERGGKGQQGKGQQQQQKQPKPQQQPKPQPQPQPKPVEGEEELLVSTVVEGGGEGEARREGRRRRRGGRRRGGRGEAAGEAGAEGQLPMGAPFEGEGSDEGGSGGDERDVAEAGDAGEGEARRRRRRRRGGRGRNRGEAGEGGGESAAPAAAEGGSSGE